MKLILVSISRKESTMSFPLGVSILKARLDHDFSKRNLDTEIIHEYLHDVWDSQKPEEVISGDERFHGAALDRILERISGSGADILGFSTYIWNREAVTFLSKTLKEQYPEMILMAGGAEATANPHSLLADSSLDYIVLGDGELVLPDLMESILTDSISRKIPVTIKGLLPAGRSVNNKDGTFITEPVYNSEPGSSPSPFLEETLDPSDFPGILWETARGCPYGCSFCYESRGRKKITSLPQLRISDELKYFTVKEIYRVMVLDPSFNTNRKHALNILRLIEECAPYTHFTFEIKGEELDEELASAFGAIDCYLQIGLQSSNAAALENVNRIFDEGRFTRGCNLLHREGVPFGLDLIYGLPGDTFEGFLASLDYSLSLKPENLDIFPLAILPGTRLGEDAEGFGLEYSRTSPYLIKAAPGFPAEAIESAAKLTAATDTFFSGGGASHWFMPVVTASGLRPSKFLAIYNAWTEENQKPCIAGQREEFVREILKSLKKEDALRASISLIRLYEAIEEVSAGEEERVVDLHYTPEELENLDMVSLSEFSTYFSEKKQRWRIRIIHGELEFRLL